MQENISIVEYEQEFVLLSNYAREIVPIEEKMCTSFEDGLNDETKMLMGALELQELMVYERNLHNRRQNEMRV